MNPSPHPASAANFSPAPHLPQIRLYQDWLRAQRGLAFSDYHALWQWSVTDLDAFWQSIWDYFDLRSPTPHSAVLQHNAMPGAIWFPGAQTNYAHQVLRHVDAAHAAGCPALVCRNERGEHREISWPELRRQVASMALHLQAQGLEPGDRVAAYLPNIPEAMVAFLATVSLGGIWSICAPDMGTAAVLDRFRQIEPKILIAVDGVRYGGRDLDRRAVVQELRAALPSVQHLIVHYNLHAPGEDAASVPDATPMAQTTARDDAAVAASIAALVLSTPAILPPPRSGTEVSGAIVTGARPAPAAAAATLSLRCLIICSGLIYLTFICLMRAL